MKNTIMSKRMLKRVKIQALYKAGASNKKICKELKVSEKTVIKWKKKRNFEDKPKGKPLTKIDRFTKNVINYKLNGKNDSSIRKTTDALNESKMYVNAGKTISKSTIQNYVKSTKWGKKAFKSQFKPKLSDKNIIDRQNFAKIVDKSGYLEDTRRGEKMRSHILFTDEAMIELYPKSNATHGRFRTENREDVPPHDSVKFSPKLMIAGGFCANGVTKLHFIENGSTITGKYYRDDILPIYFDAINNPVLFSSKRNVTFMQDGAPAHGTSENMKNLNESIENVWGKGIWTGNSPDLNPIENLWSILKSKIQKAPIPNNIVELKERIEYEWQNIPLSHLKNLSESFKNRIDEMSKNNGGHTKY